MYTEILILSGVSYLYLTHDDRKIKKRWNKIIASKSEFTNNLGKSLKILDIDHLENGIELKVELPYGYTFKKLMEHSEVFREGMGYDELSLEPDGNIVTFRFANKQKFKDYTVIPLPPNQLLFGNGQNSIFVDMNRFPHVLIGGDVGSGKSRLLLVALTNLIATTKDEAEIYLLQIRKNDLGVFQNCKQVKSYSRNLEEVLEALKEIDQECQRREELIDNTRGYYSIVDYNKDNESLKYVYVVIDEFSFFNISKGDSKEEKEIKAECLKYIKAIVNVGRSSGIFLITSLQKPTSDSIPTDIKAQLSTRISMKILDEPTSQVVLGNGHATNLDEREFICRTFGEEKGQTFTINHGLVMKNIKNKIEKKPPKIKKEVERYEVDD